jgi:biotin synthase
MASPETVRTSLAAAMTLGLKKGRFYRGAKLGCINLLMEYEDGCRANCQYCGQGREISESPECKSLIRVEWPSYSLDEVVRATKKAAEKDRFVQRVCISSLTKNRVPSDLVYMLKKIREGTGLKVSSLVTPTVFSKNDFEAIKEAGGENITIAVDCATPELFQKLRGKTANSPHKWERYIEGIREAVEVMGNGPNAVGVHLIIGLGETEEEAIRFIQQCYDMGARVHLFSFYPEETSPMNDRPQPPMDNYRRVQLARHLFDRKMVRVEKMKFEDGKLIDFGVPAEDLKKVIESGTPFMTSGCPGCNRPFANETPTQALEGLLRNYPFKPTEEDIETIKQQF